MILAAGAVSECVLETRDAGRLTAGDTFTSLQGRRIRYRLTGATAQGPTIVLLCGLMGSLEQWDHVQEVLGATMPVLSYDRAGTGFSDPGGEHDAIGEADELDALLHAARVTTPIVLVGYSSSSLLARVFAARHRTLVAGLVFVDPVVPDALRALPPEQRPTYSRIYGRVSITTTIQAFFGYTRLRFAIARRHDPPASRVIEKEDAIIVSFHHWLGTAREALELDHSSDEAMATAWFGNIPLGVMSTADPEDGERARYISAGQRELATRSTSGHYLAVAHADHGRLLADPVQAAAVIEMIRDVTHAVREPGAGPP